MDITNFPKGNEQEFNKFLVREYIKFGSVDEVLRNCRFSLPISYANYQRVLDKWGIVKAAGPNSKMTEVLEFLTHFARSSIPFEKLYDKMPPSFRTSAATLYRILSYIKEGVTRRIATGLVVVSDKDREKILVADDVSIPRVELGKTYGSVSIPMGFSRMDDPREVAILRVLQQEVFCDLAIEKKLPENIIPYHPRPFMYLDIADVRVEIFLLTLSKKLSNKKYFSSFKLRNHKFVSFDRLLSENPAVNLRVGVKEAAMGYKKYLEMLDRKLTFNPLYYKSTLNYHLSRSLPIQ